MVELKWFFLADIGDDVTATLPTTTVPTTEGNRLKDYSSNTSKVKNLMELTYIFLFDQVMKQKLQCKLQ